MHARKHTWKYMLQPVGWRDCRVSRIDGQQQFKRFGPNSSVLFIWTNSGTDRMIECNLFLAVRVCVSFEHNSKRISISSPTQYVFIIDTVAVATKSKINCIQTLESQPIGFIKVLTCKCRVCVFVQSVYRMLPMDVLSLIIINATMLNVRVRGQLYSSRYCWFCCRHLCSLCHRPIHLTFCIRNGRSIFFFKVYFRYIMKRMEINSDFIAAKTKLIKCEKFVQKMIYIEYTNADSAAQHSSYT